METKKKAWLDGDWQNDRVIDSDFGLVQIEHIWNFHNLFIFITLKVTIKENCWRYQGIHVKQ